MQSYSYIQPQGSQVVTYNRVLAPTQVAYAMGLQNLNTQVSHITEEPGSSLYVEPGSSNVSIGTLDELPGSTAVISGSSNDSIGHINEAGHTIYTKLYSMPMM